MTKMDLFDLYQKVIAYLNTAQGGFLRPQVNFLNYLRTINNELFRDCFDDYEKSQQLSDEYKLPFLKSKNIVLTTVANSPFDTFAYPTDYEYFSSSRIYFRKDGIVCPAPSLPFLKGCNNKGKAEEFSWEDPDMKEIKAKLESADSTELPVSLMDNQRFGAALKHLTKGPTRKSPIITQFDGGFKVAPKGLGVIVLDYLRTPTVPVFAFAPGTGDTIIYNQGASVQLDWSSIVENEILSRIEMKYGNYVREESVVKNATQEYQIAHK